MLKTQICVTRPQCVNTGSSASIYRVLGQVASSTKLKPRPLRGLPWRWRQNTATFLSTDVATSILASYVLQKRPTNCTILLNIFISPLYMFRASMCPSSWENYCIYSSLVFVTLYVWGGVWSADQTPPIRNDKHQCSTETVIFQWWWAHGCPKHIEKRNKYIKQNCALILIYLQDYSGIHCQHNIKSRKLYYVFNNYKPSSRCNWVFVTLYLYLPVWKTIQSLSKLIRNYYTVSN